MQDNDVIFNSNNNPVLPTYTLDKILNDVGLARDYLRMLNAVSQYPQIAQHETLQKNKNKNPESKETVEPYISALKENISNTELAIAKFICKKISATLKQVKNNNNNEDPNAQIATNAFKRWKKTYLDAIKAGDYTLADFLYALMKHTEYAEEFNNNNHHPSIVPEEESTTTVEDDWTQGKSFAERVKVLTESKSYLTITQNIRELLEKQKHPAFPKNKSMDEWEQPNYSESNNVADCLKKDYEKGIKRDIYEESPIEAKIEAFLAQDNINQTLTLMNDLKANNEKDGSSFEAEFSLLKLCRMKAGPEKTKLFEAWLKNSRKKREQGAKERKLNYQYKYKLDDNERELVDNFSQHTEANSAASNKITNISQKEKNTKNSRLMAPSKQSIKTSNDTSPPTLPEEVRTQITASNILHVLQHDSAAEKVSSEHHAKLFEATNNLQKQLTYTKDDLNLSVFSRYFLYKEGIIELVSVDQRLIEKKLTQDEIKRLANLISKNNGNSSEDSEDSNEEILSFLKTYNALSYTFNPTLSQNLKLSNTYEIASITPAEFCTSSQLQKNLQEYKNIAREYEEIGAVLSEIAEEATENDNAFILMAKNKLFNPVQTLVRFPMLLQEILKLEPLAFVKQLEEAGLDKQDIQTLFDSSLEESNSRIQKGVVLALKTLNDVNTLNHLTKLKMHLENQLKVFEYLETEYQTKQKTIASKVNKLWKDNSKTIKGERPTGDQVKFECTTQIKAALNKKINEIKQATLKIELPKNYSDPTFKIKEDVIKPYEQRDGKQDNKLQKGLFSNKMAHAIQGFKPEHSSGQRVMYALQLAEYAKAHPAFIKPGFNQHQALNCHVDLHVFLDNIISNATTLLTNGDYQSIGVFDSLFKAEQHSAQQFSGLTYLAAMKLEKEGNAYTKANASYFNDDVRDKLGKYLSSFTKAIPFVPAVTSEQTHSEKNIKQYLKGMK